jgi:hypothetical protein
MDLRQLAAALGGVVSNGQCLAPGPGHSKGDRSLAVKIDSNAPDGFVVFSHAGDDPIVCKDYVRQRCGLPKFEPRKRKTAEDVARFVAKFVNSHITEQPRGTVAATYPYTDQNGVLLYEVQRYEPKTFRARRPNGNGGWTDSLDGFSRRVLYQWPNIAKYPFGTVFVTEGEKDADRLASLDLCATTVAFGRWEDECVQPLAGRDIMVLQDNDAAGARKALEAATRLHGVANTLRVVLLPDLPDGGDVSDWLDADPRRAEKLVDICFDAPLWKPTTEEPRKEEHAGRTEQATRTRKEQSGGALITVSAADIPMEHIEWLWPNRFARGKLGLIGGMPEEGKSQIAIDICARITRTQEWPCGEGTAPLGSCIILSAEDAAADTLVPRLAAAGADRSRVEIAKAVADQEGKTRLFSLIEDIDKLERRIREIGNVLLVVIDPLSAYLGIKKIDSYRTSDVRAVLAPLSEMAERTKVAVVAIMHLNKNISMANAISRFADSLAFIATARHAYVCIADPENETRRLFLRAKNNLAPGGKGTGLAYFILSTTVDDSFATSHVAWDSTPVDITADQALAAHATARDSSGKAEAVEFLRDYLADGPMPQKSVIKAAKEYGLTNANCRDGKKALGIKPYKQKGNLKGGWMWALPGSTKVTLAEDDREGDRS